MTSSLTRYQNIPNTTQCLNPNDFYNIVWGRDFLVTVQKFFKDKISVAEKYKKLNFFCIVVLIVVFKKRFLEG